MTSHIPLKKNTIAKAFMDFDLFKIAFFLPINLSFIIQFARDGCSAAAQSAFFPYSRHLAEVCKSDCHGIYFDQARIAPRNPITYF